MCESERVLWALLLLNYVIIITHLARTVRVERSVDARLPHSKHAAQHRRNGQQGLH